MLLVTLSVELSGHGRRERSRPGCSQGPTEIVATHLRHSGGLGLGRATNRKEKV
jgi:hypothetical protein